MHRRIRAFGLAAAATLAVGWGCGEQADRAVPAGTPTFPGVTVRLAALKAPADDPDAEGVAKRLLDVVRIQSGEWVATRRASVTAVESPITPEQTAQAELIVFRGDQLGELVDVEALAALSDDELLPPPPPDPSEVDGFVPEPPDPLNMADMVPAFRDAITLYGSRRYALPLGGSALVLVYRRDVLERPENRQAAQEAGLSLEPPETYEQLEALARFFDGRDWGGTGEPAGGIAVPATGAEARRIALTRAGALGLHPDYYAFLFDDESLTPWVAMPPFVEAWQGHLRLLELGPKRLGLTDIASARAAFRDGKAVFLIDRAEAAAQWTDTSRPVPSTVAPLPGSRRVFDPDRRLWQDLEAPNRPAILPNGGGWLVGLSRHARGPVRAAALDLLKDLAGPETSARIIASRESPLLPVRQSRLGIMPDSRSAPGVDSRTWARTVAGTLTALRVLPDLRIPEAAGYLADLPDPSPTGDDPAANIPSRLEEAARRWSTRSERLGLRRQLWHYRASMNRPGEAPTPPPRATSTQPSAPEPRPDAPR